MFATAGIENVIFRSIVKHGSKDEAVYGVTKVKPFAPGGDVAAMVADFIAEDTPATIEHHQVSGLTSLSFAVNPRRNLYVIKLDGSTRAAFGPGASPIMTLPPKMGKDLFEDVQLLCPAGGSSLKAWAADNIPKEFADMPDNAVLSFVCDRNKLEALWQSVMPKEHKGFAPKVPFFLNLYDTDTQSPVWTFLDPNQRHTHGDNGVTTHGGIHPGSAVQSLY